MPICEICDNEYNSIFVIENTFGCNIYVCEDCYNNQKINNEVQKPKNDTKTFDKSTVKKTQA